MNPPQSRKVVAAGMIGNALEWYDFAVYGYFAVPIGRHFFPHEDPIAQLLAAFGVFALGYLVRPLGGVVVGHIGDRFGRRPALIFSVGAMAIPTFLIGILPGYVTLGVLAPIALTLLRVVQGISVGGEYPCSMVFMVESAGEGRRGLIGAFAAMGAVIGILSGSAVGALLAAAMSPEMLEAWGWRIPFLFGLVAGAVGLVLRRQALASEPVAPTAHAPIVETLRDHGRTVAHLVALTAFTSIPFHIMFIYIVSWLQVADGIPPATALEINTVNMILLLPAMLLAGWASDRYGRRPILMASTVLGFLTALPLFWVMQHPSLALLGQFGLMLVVSPFIGAFPALLVESAPPRVRCTAVGLGYNICLALTGGTAPLVATWLVERTGNELSPAFVIIAAAAVSFTALLWTQETYRRPLERAVAAPAA
jgi:MHS family proline/betaine transporter-like MFS transporter